ncbi:MAG: hypothetical protein DRI39_05570 [Chloroflexi bacterium]|nr:MAG: hypothetical protein DRI39_05570 [Chloroflexota bacterium]
MSGPHRLLWFVVRVFILILVSASFWRFVAPSYTSLLAAVSDGMAPPATVMTAVDNTISVHIQGQAASATIDTMPFQAGLLLLVALIMATPGLRLKQRLAYAVLGSIIAFAVHVLSVLTVSSHMGTMSPMLFLFVSLGVDLFPILIWATLSARYWCPGRAASRVRTGRLARAGKRS